MSPTFHTSPADGSVIRGANTSRDSLEPMSIGPAYTKAPMDKKRKRVRERRGREGMMVVSERVQEGEEKRLCAVRLLLHRSSIAKILVQVTIKCHHGSASLRLVYPPTRSCCGHGRLTNAPEPESTILEIQIGRRTIKTVVIAVLSLCRARQSPGTKTCPIFCALAQVV